MYIGKASKLTGATPKAIRHYEAIGLIPPQILIGWEKSSSLGYL